MLDNRTEDFLTSIGIDYKTEMFYPIIEDHNDDELIVKFMSDHGVEDINQGDQFRIWLTNNSIPFRGDGRLYFVDKKKFNSLIN